MENKENKTNEMSYEHCPLRKQGLDGIEDKCFRCKGAFNAAPGSKHSYYRCYYKGDNFEECPRFKNHNRSQIGSSSGYYGCDAGAIG